MAKETEVTFLGLCERADFNESQARWNILGLSHVIFSHIYPLNLSGLGIGLSVKSVQLNQSLSLRIREENGKEIGFIDLTADPKVELEKDASGKTSSPRVPLLQSGWSPPIFTKFGKPGITVYNPGRHLITLGDEVIGELYFVVVEPEPLSVERIAAIKSDPLSSKAVRITLGCKKCPSQLKLYSALETSKSLEKEGFIVNTSAPDEFTCECTSTKIDARILKRNLHALLGSRAREGEEMSYVKMYERSVLEGIRSEFCKLLAERNPKEEKIQKFIEQNPVLLHQFVPSSDDRIIFKPKFSTKYIGDFAFVTPQKELVIIEIEPLIKLVKKDGHSTAELNHAFGQVRDWLHEINEHKVAVLDGLGVKREKVGKVRGVVIAGRDAGHDENNLRKIKGTDHGQVSFLTYDDILASMDTLISSIEKV